MKKISIIIVTYNSQENIYACIDSVMENADIDKNEFEVIIVDNASDDVDEMFNKINKRYGEDIILVKNNKNGGYGQGNNIGIKKASSPIILIMNPDVRLYEPIFQKVIDVFQNDNNLLIYGLKQMVSPQKNSLHSFVCKSAMNGYLWVILSGIATRIDWYWPKMMCIQGSCFFIRKESFEQVGCFDESVFMYGEEDNIHIRLGKRYGYYFKYNPSLHYIHLAHNRMPSLEYEITLAERCVENNAILGWNKRKTIKNLLRANSLHLIRERIKIIIGRKAERFNMLRQFREYLKSQLL